MKQRTYCKEQMKADLMRVYREVTSNGECRCQTEAYELTVTHPAPRFYVDVRWAHQRLSPMMRGDRRELEKMSPLTRSMYEDLFETVLRLSQKEKYWGKPLYYIVRHAVQEPAKRFYISAARMGQIWLEKKRRKGEVRSVK